MDKEWIKLNNFIMELQRIVMEKEAKRMWKIWKEYKKNRYGYESDCK